MAFSSSFVETCRHNDPSVASRFYAQAPHAAVYSEGLLVILDEALSSELSAQWRWLLGADAQALAYTGYGDFFFWSEKHAAVFFIEVQRGRSTQVDRSVEFTLEQFLTQQGALDKVLQRERIEQLIAHLGPLTYGSCFIAQPWESLGGSGAVETFASG